MKKILYICSSLERTGPTNQLLNIVSGLNRDFFEPLILTLSTEGEDKDNMVEDFRALDIPIIFNNLGSSIFNLRKLVLKSIIRNNIRIVHTQGIRSDVIMSTIKYDNWISTLRNVPYLDYPPQYGVLGVIMAFIHILSLCTCNKVVLVSSSNYKRLKLFFKKNSRVIRNGVDVESFKKSNNEVNIDKNINFIYTGILENRKNILALLDYIYSDKRFKLILVGDGILRDAILAHQAYINNQVEFVGYVDNVKSYLIKADVFIMLSKAEGFPNSAMEAYAMGIPLILSNIEPHLELKKICPYGIKIYDIYQGDNADLNFINIRLWANALNCNKITFLANECLSSSINSNRYQELYNE